jgi:hypothetical protein
VPSSQRGVEETGSGMVGAEQGQMRIEQMPDAGKSVSFINAEKSCESESECS